MSRSSDARLRVNGSAAYMTQASSGGAIRASVRSTVRSIGGVLLGREARACAAPGAAGGRRRARRARRAWASASPRCSSTPSRTPANASVLRATGVESESELAYAGLHALLHPVLGLLDRLPEPHADALACAFGLRAGRVEDRFLVSLATEGLLGLAAGEAGVLCVVDDAQSLDRASADGSSSPGGAWSRAASRCSSRRASGWRAGCRSSSCVASRPGRPPSSWARRSRPRSANGWRRRPGAIRSRSSKPPRVLTAEQLAGREPLADPLPVGEEVERVFLAAVRRLGPDAQALALLVAADDTQDRATIARAAVEAGTDRRSRRAGGDRPRPDRGAARRAAPSARALRGLTARPGRARGDAPISRSRPSSTASVAPGIARPLPTARIRPRGGAGGVRHRRPAPQCVRGGGSGAGACRAADDGAGGAGAPPRGRGRVQLGRRTRGARRAAARPGAPAPRARGARLAGSAAGRSGPGARSAGRGVRAVRRRGRRSWTARPHLRARDACSRRGGDLVAG